MLPGEDGEDDRLFADADWSEAEESCQDLFSSATFSGPSACLAHIRETHGLDLALIRFADEYEWIRAVNFCRRKHSDGASVPEIVAALQESPRPYAHGEEYLRPVLDDDALLYAFDEIFPDVFESEAIEAAAAAGVERGPDADEVERLRADLAQCQQKIRELVLGSDEGGDQVAPAGLTRPVRSDEYYFDSYGHLDIHEEMLRDRPRTESYRDALEYLLKSDKVPREATVVDIGCGTGILSLFAARAGAKAVVGVEASRIAELAERIVASNGYKDTVKIARGRLEMLELDVKADVIVSEWMGYGLLFESMLDSVLDARDRYLAPGGVMVPCGATIFVQGQNDTSSFWNDVYGFDFSVVKDALRPKDPLVQSVREDTIVTDRAAVFDIDIQTATKADLDFTASTQLTVATAGPLTGIVISFDCEMVRESGIVLSTAVETTQTHWVQTVLPLREPLTVEAGEKIPIQLTYKRNAENPREIDITLVVGLEIVLTYTLR